MKRFTLGESAFYSRKELPQTSETAARAKCCCVLGDCSALGFWVRRSTGDGERQGTSPRPSCSKEEPGQRVGMANYVQVGITSPAVSAEPSATDRGVCSAQLWGLALVPLMASCSAVCRISLLLLELSSQRCREHRAAARPAAPPRIPGSCKERPARHQHGPGFVLHRQVLPEPGRRGGKVVPASCSLFLFSARKSAALRQPAMQLRRAQLFLNSLQALAAAAHCENRRQLSHVGSQLFFLL